MSGKVVSVSISAVVLCSLGLCLAEEAADTFNLLYGNDLKRVAATRETDDDLALAQQLLNAAKTPKAEPAMIALLADKVYELAAKDSKGAALAIEAMELAAAKVPGKKLECLDRIVSLRQHQVMAARGVARTKASEQLLAALESAADAKADAGQFDDAAAKYRQAVAATPTADAKTRIKAKLAALANRQKVAKQVADLIAEFAANPADAACRNKLIRLYLVEFDDPAEAAKYVGDGADEATRKYLPAATKPVAQVPELACLELGDWYMTLSDKASDSAKVAMLRRATLYYKRFLELHKSQDPARTKATLALKKAEATGVELAKATAGEESSGWIDVLRLVDLGKDVKAGKWEFRKEGLRVAPDVGDQKVVVPVVPEGSYELQVIFTRALGERRILVHLPVGPTAVNLRVGMKGGGLEKVTPEVKASWDTSQLNRPYTLHVTVVAQLEKTSLEVKVDGKSYLKWQGPWTSLTPGWDELPLKTLALGADFSDVTFRSMQLRMISGKATLLRPPTPQTPADR